MLISKIERFLRETAMPPSVFGRRALGDPGFVRSLRNGREPRPRTEARAVTFMTDYRATKGKHSHAN